MIDIKVPRHAIYSSFTSETDTCSRCGGKLSNERQTYAIATLQDEKITDSFIIGDDFGWFCEACPTLIIDKEKLGEMLSFQKSGWNIGSEHIVLGIVDLDAIPASKEHLPLGDPDNPLPLIKFINSPQSSEDSPPPRRRKPKKKRKRRKR